MLREEAPSTQVCGRSLVRNDDRVAFVAGRRANQPRLTPAGRRALATETGRLSDVVKRAASKGSAVTVRR